MHVEYVDGESVEQSQSANTSVSKCKNCTFEEFAILKELVKKPDITQKELAMRIGKSERTIKSKMIQLQNKGCIRRINGKRYGKWEVLVEVDN